MSDSHTLNKIAKSLVVPKKGILAADQSPTSMNKQLGALGIPETPEMRRQYRQLLFTTPRLEEYVTGVILHDGTIRNHADDGTQFSDVLISKGIIPRVTINSERMRRISRRCERIICCHQPGNTVELTGSTESATLKIFQQLMF